MSNLRSGPWSLKDPDDDAAFTELKNDVTELMIRVQRGTQNSPALTNQAISNYIAASATMYGFHVHNNAQVIGSGTVQATYDTVLFDTTGGWNTTLNRYVVNRAGYYMASLSGYINTAGSVTDLVGSALSIYKNGSVLLSNSHSDNNTTGNVYHLGSSVAHPIPAIVGDYFEIFAGSVVAGQTLAFTSFSMYFIADQ